MNAGGDALALAAALASGSNDEVTIGPSDRELCIEGLRCYAMVQRKKCLSRHGRLGSIAMTLVLFLMIATHADLDGDGTITHADLHAAIDMIGRHCPRQPIVVEMDGHRYVGYAESSRDPSMRVRILRIDRLAEAWSF